MGLRKDARRAVKLAKDIMWSRRAQRALGVKLADRPDFEPHRFRVGVYFADGKVNLYQLRQWYAPLVALAERHPVLILSRASGAALKLLEESPLPVAYVRRVADLERVIHEQDLHVILYVNQNAKNFQMMRYGRRWHVFINHGESDKMYMTTNQFKAYDYALIAGDAARARLDKVLWDYDFDKRAIPIGRPQADHYLDGSPLPYTPDDRDVVLYAPTWEGDRDAAAYGSIASHGVDLVRGLLATGRHRVIYRPHPRSGVVDPAYGAANEAIIAALAAANAADASAQHIFDSGPKLGWQLAAADVAIVDISAMVYDRLAAGKPLLITRPVNPAAEIDRGGYLQACEWLEATDVATMVARVDEVAHDADALARLGFWVERYFGDTTPGVTTERFHAAIDHLMAEWERFAALHAGDGEIDDHDVEADVEEEDAEAVG
ncbi:CDP-glycerol glycerophosphotransferase family protein [Agromyces sp. SYSU K20354]|uniref:CDP-glycerol glycerophosphotransferase family protein n=1 Tax=Agromyces cavernae TaxID=2898659 RepID=UPI001E612B11|nr:CDP-glycerol glycerophosphotransferase family protein [Agromyces cavernae]MCD2442621.1 CDP-glycerol glycerophosphotransferase family protein [Agromyces cavernae]